MRVDVAHRRAASPVDRAEEDGAEGRGLPERDLPLAHQLEGGGEGRGDARAGDEAIAVEPAEDRRRQITAQALPAGRTAEATAQPLQRLLDAVQRRRCDLQHRRLAVAGVPAGVGAKQVVEGGMEHRLGVDLDRLRAPARKNVDPEPRPAQQLPARLAHGLQPAQLEGQPGRQILGRGLVRRSRLRRQQQPRLQVGEPGGHHQVLGRQLQIGMAHRGDEVQVLLGEADDGDLGQVHLLLARERQQQVQRPLEALEIDDEVAGRSTSGSVRRSRPRLGLAGHGTPPSARKIRSSIRDGPITSHSKTFRSRPALAPIQGSRNTSPRTMNSP